MTDWKNNDIKWNGNWQYAASINQADWTAEFAVPLNDLGISNIASGVELDLALSRSFPYGESSDWSGKCILSDKTAVKCGIGRWPDPLPGKNNISFSAQNFEKGVVILHCELELFPLNDKPEFINQAGQGPSSDLQIKMSSEPIKYLSDFSIPAGGKINESIPFNLPFEGSYYASFSVKTKDGTIIRRTVDYWFTIEPNRKKLQSLKERIGESIASMTRISNPVANDLKTEADMILHDVQKLINYADTAWKELKLKIKRLKLPGTFIK
jgi:hypothetical protein